MSLPGLHQTPPELSGDAQRRSSLRRSWPRTMASLEEFPQRPSGQDCTKNNTAEDHLLNTVALEPRENALAIVRGEQTLCAKPEEPHTKLCREEQPGADLQCACGRTN